MADAQQRLVEGDLARMRPDDRLQGEAHAAVVQRGDGLDVEAGLLAAGAAARLRPGHDGGIDRPRAGAGEGAFRRGEQRAAMGAELGGAGGADAQAHQRDAAAGLDRRLGDDLDEAAGGGLDLFRRAADQEDREAVAGIADEMVAPARHRAQALMHGADDLVGGLMTEIVVEPGELVDRGDENHDRPFRR